LDFDYLEAFRSEQPAAKALSLVDTGATRSVAGQKWLEQYAAKVKPFGLVPTRKQSQATFNGLGGVQKKALEVWRLPVGLYGHNLVMEYHAVPGDMIGLWGRKDMENLKTNLYVRKDAAQADFEALNLFGVELEKLPNKHSAIDLMQFDLSNLDGDMFAEFRVDPGAAPQEEAQLISMVSDVVSMHQVEREDLVPDAVAAGRVGALPKRVGQSWEKVGKAYEQIAMVLKDEEQVLLWEFH
jgi:hypothetical protein